MLFLPSAPIILTFLYLSPASSTISFLHVITTSCRNRLHSTPDAVSNAVGFCVIFNSHVKNETRKDVFKKEGRSFKVRDGCGGWGVKCILLSFCSPAKFHYRISLVVLPQLFLHIFAVPLPPQLQILVQNSEVFFVLLDLTILPGTCPANLPSSPASSPLRSILTPPLVPPSFLCNPPDSSYPSNSLNFSSCLPFPHALPLFLTFSLPSTRHAFYLRPPKPSSTHCLSSLRLPFHPQTHTPSLPPFPPTLIASATKFIASYIFFADSFIYSIYIKRVLPFL